MKNFFRSIILMTPLFALSGCLDSSDQIDVDGVDGTDSATDSDTDSDTSSDSVIDDTSDSTDSSGLLPAPCESQPDFTPCNLVTTPEDRSYDICVDEKCVSPGCGDVSCNAPGPHFPIPDTNSRDCFHLGSYNNSATMTCAAEGEPFYGQDAQYGWDTTHSHTERYTRDRTESARNVITDDVTTLAWQGCTSGRLHIACRGRGHWYTWAEAFLYCEKLEWGVYNDWRLPDIHELESIIEKHSIDDRAFQPEHERDGSSWSSSTSAANHEDAWYFTYNGASLYVKQRSKSDYLPVRCVRGGSPVRTDSRFLRNEEKADEPVVTDNVTTLEWQGCTAGLSSDDCAAGTPVEMIWEAALSYCENLNWGSYRDWRLPNYKELHSITDKRRHDPAIEVDAFPGTPPEKFLTSTDQAWTVNFLSGEMIWHQIDNSPDPDPDVITPDLPPLPTGLVRCVRGGV